MRTRAAVAALSTVGALVTTGAVAPPPSPPPTDDLAAVDAYLSERRAATNTPGLAYAVVTSDSVERLGAHGHDGNGGVVTATTPFLWGSVSKPVTATAVMTLVEDGAMALDEPVRTYLPSFTLADPDAAARITVRHLLTHTSGIPEHTSATDRVEDDGAPYAEAVAELAHIQPMSAPGAKHQYSSANYLLLGAAVEEVSGSSFAGYLHDAVLDPLGMTGAITTAEQAHSRLPGGHGYVFGHPVGVSPGYAPAGPSYGYLGGTVEDLAHFAMAQLADGHDSARTLDPESAELMHTGAVRVGGTQRYGLGWRDDTRNDDLGTSTVWHGGAVPGYQATIALLPEADRAVVVLQNAYGIFQDAELLGTGLGAARILAGGRAEPASGDATYAALLGTLTAALAAAVAVTGWALFRIRKPGPRAEHRRVLLGTAGWTLGGLALAGVAWFAVPSLFGVSLARIRLWAPDIVWLLTALAVTGLVLAVARLVSGIARLTTRRTATAALG
ncbi:serine hydrolase domain-containing protein [Saccharomonospora piscinae]|uniref:serine hydrolase domain-containing protein n=1 Tax=Saccharomonospora piscinae TaxID=687388 RepID=UPI000464809B|nr:serine hydrolase domain-containing protein [Saccharomonospora piscinae]